MFFFLSKTLNYITMPLVIVCVCFILSVFLKANNWKTRFFKIGLILLLFFSNDFITNEVVLWWEVAPTPITAIQKRYECGILLTGIAKSEMEPADRVYFSRGADRVTHTLQLYKLGIIKKILVAGGNGKLTPVNRQEADAIAEVLVLMGVAASDILIENKSRNTHESAIEVDKLYRDNIKPEQCLLITSSFHCRRSKACFAKQGWNVDVFSTDFLSHRRKFTPDVLIIPSVGALNHWHILVREWTGMLAYKLMGYI